jgi:hypothetical protein
MPSTNWLGLQKIIDWIFDVPTSVAVFILSFIVLVVLVIAQGLLENYMSNRRPGVRR